jgi:phospholipid/cholesterol/gamma-HCH transport system substrate-binding protein
VRRAQSDVVVGAFVLCAVGLMLWGTLKVGGSPDWIESDTRAFHARFENVAGLHERTRVAIAGVPVGEVARIDLDGARAMVTLAIERDDIEVPVDSVLAIRSRGLLGEKELELIPGRAETLLEPGGVITRTHSSQSMDRLIDGVTDLAADLNEVSRTFRNVLGGADGEEAVREIVANARAVSSDLRRLVSENEERLVGIALNLESFSSDLRALTEDNADSVRETLEGFRTASLRLNHTLDRVATLSDKVENGEGTLGKLVADEELYDELKGAVADARSALREVRRAAEETQEQVPATILTTLLGSLF